MDIFLLILGIIAVLIIDYLIAREFYVAANEKGYTESKYLWIPFLFGVAGYLLVIALPYKDIFIEEANEMSESSETDEMSENDELSETFKEIIKTLSETSEIIEYVNGLYIKEIEIHKNIRSTVKINGEYYSHSDWLSEGKIEWYKTDLKIYGIKEKTANVPYVLKFELVEEGIDITGFPDEMYNGLYVKK